MCDNDYYADCDTDTDYDNIPYENISTEDADNMTDEQISNAALEYQERDDDD